MLENASTLDPLETPEAPQASGGKVTRSKKAKPVQADSAIGDSTESTLPVSVEVAAEAGEKKKRKKRENGPEEISRGYKIRLYPTPEQEEKFAQAIGTCRLIWNEAIALQRQYRATHQKMMPMNDLSKALTAMRADPARPWMAETPRATQEQVLRNNASAWSLFFDAFYKRQAGTSTRKVGVPDFHKKSGNDAAKFVFDPRLKDLFRFEEGLIKLEGIGYVACSTSEPWVGHLSAITVRRKAGKWFGTITAGQVPVAKHRRNVRDKLVQFEDPYDPKGVLGVDGGVACRATCSDGLKLFHPPALTDRQKKGKRKKERSAERKRVAMLATLGLLPHQKIPFGTKVPRSNREQRDRDAVAKYDLDVSFKRQDDIHQFTTALVVAYHTIVIEDLNLAAMARSMNRHFRRRMHEAAMGEMYRQLEYKCAYYGRTLIKVGRYFPSSKKCSTPGCTFLNRELKLSQRTWTCPECGTTHDRDENAAICLKQEGLRILEKQRLKAAEPALSNASESALTEEQRKLPAGRRDVMGAGDRQAEILEMGDEAKIVAEASKIFSVHSSSAKPGLEPTRRMRA